MTAMWDITEEELAMPHPEFCRHRQKLARQKGGRADRRFWRDKRREAIFEIKMKELGFNAIGDTA